MKLVLIMLMALGWYALDAQIQVERSVLANWGGSSSGEMLVDATLGETHIGIESDNDVILTIGFHQTTERTTSVRTIISEDIIVFPNPSVGEVHLRVASPIESIRVLDMFGRVACQTDKKWSRDAHINLGHLPDGQYEVLLKTVEGSCYVKTLLITR